MQLWLRGDVGVGSCGRVAATSHAGLSMVARPRALVVLDAAFALCFPVPVMLGRLSATADGDDSSPPCPQAPRQPLVGGTVLSCTAHSRPYLAPYWDGEAGGD